MTTWMNRFSLVVRSSITSLREKVEDPERMLHQLICDMEEELQTVKKAVAAAIADEIQLGKQVDAAKEESRKWQSRAETAIKRGDESSARSALEQQMRTEERAATLEKSYLKQKAQTEKLRSSFRDLEDKIQQARHKQTLLVARMANAESTQAINHAMDRANGQSAFAEFSRLEKKVERQEAMTQAYDVLDGRDLDADELDAEFEKEERREKLEKELEKLRQRLSDE
ncbi:MAG: PspA/IM30 family protein [Planctomycetaceae bacterium]|nr:PspA/IM30 family protein [Planctomycetaceae bacterium]